MSINTELMKGQEGADNDHESDSLGELRVGILHTETEILLPHNNRLPRGERVPGEFVEDSARRIAKDVLGLLGVAKSSMHVGLGPDKMAHFLSPVYGDRDSLRVVRRNLATRVVSIPRLLEVNEQNPDLFDEVDIELLQAYYDGLRG